MGAGGRGLGDGIPDELRADGKRQTAGRDELGLQEGMEVQGGVAAAVGDAVFAVVAAETQEVGAIHGHDEASEEAKGVQRLHSDEAVDTPGSQSGQGVGADMAEEVVKGFVHGQRGLVSGGEAIGIVQHLRSRLAQVEVELATTSQLQAEQQQAPPGQKLLVILDEGGKAGIGQLVELVVEAGPEMANGFDEGAAEAYDLGVRRWRAFTWVRTCAIASWEIS